MKFTPSKDGIPRMTVTIKFRVGTDLLHVAAADEVWVGMVDHPQTDTNPDDVAKVLARKLTRGSILRRLRRSLQSNGYEGGGTDDDWWQIAHDVTAPVIERLWPDEVAATKAAKAVTA